MSLHHFSWHEIGRSQFLNTVSCYINLDDLWLIRNFKKRFSYLDWDLMFCLRRRLTAEINPKKVRGLTCNILFWKAARGKKLEDSSIKCLTCIIPLTSQSEFLSKSFATKVTTKDVLQILSFPGKKTSDQITSISFTKRSNIFKLLTSFYWDFVWLSLRLHFFQVRNQRVASIYYDFQGSDISGSM